MAKENKIQMPGVFGGLMRYDSEYKSRFMLSPNAIVAFLVAIILFVLVLKIFWPVSGGPVSTGVPTGRGGFVISLIRSFGGL